MNHYKLGVDHLEKQDGVIICECYTLGMTIEQEPDSFYRSVTHEELMSAVCRNGYVTVTNPYQSDESMQVSFWQWLEEVDADELMCACEDVINKREGRKVRYQPTREEIEASKNKAAKVFDDMFGAALKILNGPPKSAA